MGPGAEDNDQILVPYPRYVELWNLANPEDRALIQKAAWREQFARAVVEGMASAFAK